MANDTPSKYVLTHALTETHKLEEEVVALSAKLRDKIPTDPHWRDHFGTLYTNLLVLKRRVEQRVKDLEAEFHFEQSCTIMLMSKAAIYSMLPLGLAREVNGTYELTEAYAQELAEAAAKNAGYSKVLRVWHSHKAGGVFAEVG